MEGAKPVTLWVAPQATDRHQRHQVATASLTVIVTAVGITPIVSTRRRRTTLSPRPSVRLLSEPRRVLYRLDMDLRALEYFVAVAEERSFTRAAFRMYVSQPSISQQMRALEGELGEPLFERGSAGVRLTRGGEALLPYARECLAVVAAARTEFFRRSALLQGELRLGTVSGVEETAVPDLLALFHERFPEVRVELVGGTTLPLLASVERGGLDAAVVARPADPLPAALGSHPLLDDEIVAIVSELSHLSALLELPLSELARHPLITYGSDSRLRPLIAEAFEAAGCAPNVSYATRDVPLNLALARRDVGIALVAGSDPAIRHASGVTVLRTVPPIRYSKILVWRTVPRPSAALGAFLDAWVATVDAVPGTVPSEHLPRRRNA
ncbi:LysR family transcriptional regulator [Luteimicrobium album]|uniref:LysR family transcriptional regulator n=1 Tax=Luteimicrobium album TaxID=1054550 RepID=UPI0024E12B50|nr:LysR family transcriptional regulator [Luteimicrobium album]